MLNVSFSLSLAPQSQRHKTPTSPNKPNDWSPWGRRQHSLGHRTSAIRQRCPGQSHLWQALQLVGLQAERFNDSEKCGLFVIRYGHPRYLWIWNLPEELVWYFNNRLNYCDIPKNLVEYKVNQGLLIIA